MTRLCLKLLLLALPISTVLVGITRAFAYDAAYFQQVRELLSPADDCPPPCFMGIRPGVTTAQEAIAALTVHEWVSEVLPYLDTPRTFDGLVCWHWSGKQPALIDQDSFMPACAYTEGQSSIIVGMGIPTTVRFGEVWLLWRPNSVLVANYSAFRPEIAYTAMYPQNALHTSATLNCPIDLSDLWMLPTVIEFGEMANTATLSNLKILYSDLHIWRRQPPC